MRHCHLLAILLASSVFSPALAQSVEATVSTESQAQAVVSQVAMADQEDRRDRRGGEGNGAGWQGRTPAGDRIRGMGERIERAPRPAWQPRAEQPQQVQTQSVPRPDWSARRGVGNDGGGWQRREAPVIAAPATPPVVAQQAPSVDGNRGWRGDWQRRVQEVRPQAPVVNAQQDWRRNDRDGDGRPNWRDRDRDGDGVRNNRDWDRNNDGRVDGRWDRNRNGVVDRRYDWNRDGNRDNRWNNQGRWNDNRNWNGRNSNNNNRFGWNQDWRNDRRYDWQRYRYSNRDLYRLPRYSSPFGYGYRYQRFGIGFYLESVLFGSRYRISDPSQYRLPYAEWPYQWVRYYDDVLLVDTRNGYIVDVIYDFFW